MSAFLKMVVGMIPWGDIVKEVPSIVSAARGAFEKSGTVTVNADRITPDMSPEEAVELVREDISLLRTLVGELQAESARKSLLVQELSERNARLSDAVLALRARLRVVFVLALFGFAGALAAIWMAVR